MQVASDTSVATGSPICLSCLCPPVPPPLDSAVERGEVHIGSQMVSLSDVVPSKCTPPLRAALGACQVAKVVGLAPESFNFHKIATVCA